MNGLWTGAYKTHKPKDSFPLGSVTISGICPSDNPSDNFSLALHLLKTNICPFSGMVGPQVPHTSLLRYPDTQYTVPVIGLQRVNFCLGAPQLTRAGESFLKSSEYIEMKDPSIFSVVWNRAGRKRRGRFLLPNLACQGVSYLTPDPTVINNVIRCNL